MKYWTTILFLTTLLTVCNSCDNREQIGNDIVKRIEDYRIKNNRLPETLTDIGLEEKNEGPIYYRKESTTDYIVWYGLTLGESRTYDSKTKKWD